MHFRSSLQDSYSFFLFLLSVTVFLLDMSCSLIYLTLFLFLLVVFFFAVNDFDAKKMKTYVANKKKGEAIAPSSPLKIKEETVKDSLKSKVAATSHAPITIRKRSQSAAIGTSNMKARTDGVDNTSLLVSMKDKGIMRLWV